MNKLIKLIAFDGDDTLWTNMPFYLEAVEKIKTILGKYTDITVIPKEVYETETENLSVLGYGTKSFIISMIEAAIKVTSQKIHPKEIQEIITIGKSLMNLPVELLPNVRKVVADLSSDNSLMILTKGDLFEQKSKILRSGLLDYFKYIEIVSEKDEQTYSEILEKYNIEPENFLMIGNSLRSDIVPVLNIGANAVYIPHNAVWYHEEVSGDVQKEYYEINDIRELPGLLGVKFELTSSFHL
ncbi:MAG: HAD family hydrolase [Desulfobacterales bacterium]|nr:HAD family hydrolase [Desulfobacterales bacterium]